MPTEAELRRRLHDEDATPIDTAAVIRLARRRRLSRRVALGTTVTLAVVGIGVAGIAGIRGIGGIAATDSAGGVTESAEDDGDVLRAPSVAVGGCGSSPAAAGPAVNGLELRTEFPDVAAADGSVLVGTVILTNIDSTRITGTTPLPTIAIVRDGIVVGYNSEPVREIAATLDLGPGESMRYESTITVVACDGAPRDRSPLEPGNYELTAAIGFTSEVVGATSTPTDPVVLTVSGEPLTVE